MVTVRVSATTANLGPGFDSFGCAFALYDTISFTERNDGALTFEGCEVPYCNFDNLAVVAYRNTMNRLGLPMPGLHVAIRSDIPICRGLGSSAALIVAGAVAANAAHGDTLSRMELLEICNAIEGHPDNLAPALLGGMTVSLVENGKPYTVRYELSRKLRFTALIPSFELSTHKAREALPAKVDFPDAVFNVSHAGVLLKALEIGDEALIRVALSDRLHQPYRAALIPEYDRVRALALSCGALAFCISGAGPTLLCLSAEGTWEDRLRREIGAIPGEWQVLSLPVEHEGAKVLI
jgi:homoserine kinase